MSDSTVIQCNILLNDGKTRLNDQYLYYIPRQGEHILFPTETGTTSYLVLNVSHMLIDKPEEFTPSVSYHEVVITVCKVAEHTVSDQDITTLTKETDDG